MALLICPHQPSCPGCPRLATPGLAPEPLARLARLAERAGAPPPPVHTGPPSGFRYRARLAIRGRADAPKLGIFEAGTHRAVHIPRCLVHHPVINVVAAKVRDALARHRVPTYSDAAHAGVARYVQIVVERESQKAQVTLVTNEHTPAQRDVFTALARDLAPELHGLWWNGNAARTNTILGPDFQLMAGAPNVRDRSGDAVVFYPPGAFGQSNLGLASELGDAVRAEVPAGARVLELYSGVGAIGLGLATSASELHLNELGAGSLAGLELGVAALPVDVRDRVRVHAGPAADSAHLVSSSEVVIADPPRKGLDPAVLSALVTKPPERFIYVSCDIDSFERDAAALLGSLRLSSVAAYDLFPHTEHIETMAVFARR